MKLNIRINDYLVTLSKELSETELKKHDFKKVGFFARALIKPQKDEIVWWSKNCSLKYLYNDWLNNIKPNLDIKTGAEIMFGTSAYLWFKENKLIKFTFQIIQNKITAQFYLEKLEKQFKEFCGYPVSSERPFVIWELENQKFIIEYPQQTHGYVHLTSKDL